MTPHGPSRNDFWKLRFSHGEGKEKFWIFANTVVPNWGRMGGLVRGRRPSAQKQAPAMIPIRDAT
jgi:hypothetical protein